MKIKVEIAYIARGPTLHSVVVQSVIIETEYDEDRYSLPIAGISHHYMSQGLWLDGDKTWISPSAIISISEVA